MDLKLKKGNNNYKQTAIKSLSKHTSTCRKNKSHRRILARKPLEGEKNTFSVVIRVILLAS